MDSLPTVLLKPGEADRVLAGHPWIYAASILRITRPANDGDVVQVKDHRQRLLGTGFFNSLSRIRVRMLTEERAVIDDRFFASRIKAALEVRRRHMPKATSFRVVNSESDMLSGLIVDKYEDVLVLQTSSLGMDARKHIIVRVLCDLLMHAVAAERVCRISSQAVEHRGQGMCTVQSPARLAAPHLPGQTPATATNQGTVA